MFNWQRDNDLCLDTTKSIDYQPCNIKCKERTQKKHERYLYYKDKISSREN